MEPLLALFLTFALMWVLLIRPQQRRMRQHQEIVSSLRPGDEIVTAGGLYGTIHTVGEDELTVEIAPGTNVRIAKRAVAAVFPPEEDEEEEAVVEAEGDEAEAVEPEDDRPTGSTGPPPS